MDGPRRRLLRIALAVDLALLVAAAAAMTVGFASSSHSVHITHAAGSDVSQTDTYSLTCHLNSAFFAVVAVATTIIGGLLVRRLRSGARPPGVEQGRVTGN